jgi:hypothetical protein
MSPFAKVLFMLGSIITLIGSFLPWRKDGDFVSYWTQGIQIYPSIKDNGGFLLVLLTVLLIISTFRPPQFLGSRSNWKVIFAIIVVTDAFFHVGRLLIDRRSNLGFVGAPTIQIGLIMILVGSLLLLASVAMYDVESKP